MVRPVIRVPYSEERGRATSRPLPTHPSPMPRSVMHKVPSLLFDMDLDAELSQLALGDALDETGLAGIRASVLAALEPTSEAEHMVLLHVRFAREDAARRGRPLTLHALAEVLQRLGYGVRLRTARGGGRCGACLRNLRHSFLAVALTGPGAHCGLIVDPAFREQFELAHMPERYRRVMAAVPEEVVVTPARLKQLVEVLCAEMQRAFGELGLSLPPWRAASAMLSKWQPVHGKAGDESVMPRRGHSHGSSAASKPGPRLPTEALSPLPPRSARPSSGAARGLLPTAALPRGLAPWRGCSGCGSRACAAHAESHVAALAGDVELGASDDEVDASEDEEAGLDADRGLSPCSSKGDVEEEDLLAGTLDMGVSGHAAHDPRSFLARLRGAEVVELASPVHGSSPRTVATPSSASDDEDADETPCALAAASASLHVNWALGTSRTPEGSLPHSILHAQ